MRRYLLVLLSFTFFLPSRVWGQSNQVLSNGETTSAVNFPGGGCTYNWVNDSPGIGLAASGTGDIPSFTAVNNGNTAVIASINATPVAANFAYIANQGTNAVSVLNTITQKTVTTVPVGLSPFGVAASADGSKVYVANTNENAEGFYEGNGTVSVINTSTNTVSATVKVGLTPTGIAITPDGTAVYVANVNDGTISVINTSSNTVVSTISGLYGPQTVAITPDGKWVYVSNNAGGRPYLYVISTSTNVVVSTITVPFTGAEQILISLDGSKVYLEDFNGDTIAVISTATNTVIATIPVGTNPFGLCISPDGKSLYVADESSKEISVINTSSNLVTNTIPLNNFVFTISITPDGKEIYATGQSPDGVSVINTQTNSVTQVITDVQYPFGLGNFISKGPGCNNSPTQFTITVNPTPAAPPTITTGTATGTISACTGSASASPQTQQFTVSGTNLTGNITATAPAGFEVSLTVGSGYGNSVTIAETGGTAGNTVVYVRSASSDPAGPISGNVNLTSVGASSQTVAVKGTVNALPTVNTIPNQSLNNGAATTAVNFTGTGNTFTWTNDTPAIGLAASGSGDIASFVAVNTGGSPVTANVTVTPVSAALAYIVNQGSNTLSVFNTATSAVVATIPVGVDPYGAIVSADGFRVYVLNLGDNTVSVINTQTNTVMASLPIGNGPYGIVESPDDSKVYVTNLNDNTISVINTTSNAVTTIPVGAGTYGAAISPDGNTLYLSNYNVNTLTVFNTVTNSVIATVNVGSAPEQLAVSPDGKEVFVVNDVSNSVSVVSTATNTVVATINVGAFPTGVAISPDGSTAYVTNGAGNTVSVINTATNMVIATIAVGNTPVGLSISADGSLAYVINAISSSISVINTANNTVITTIPEGKSPGAFGAFMTKGSGCSGTPVKFSITVNPGTVPPPAITAGAANGTISACAGAASVSPQIQQFTVSGSNLTGNITATAPPGGGFEISLTAGSGYGPNITLTQSGGVVSNTNIYVRSSASAATGTISGNVTLTSNAATQVVAVTGTVNAWPTANTVQNQTVNDGAAISAINFTGSGNTFTWTNDTPGIGLAASGTGDINSFTATNTTGAPLTATITVIPASAPYAYITGGSVNGVSIINTLTDTALPLTLSMGNPFEVLPSPDGKEVYISTGTGNGQIAIINTATNQLIGTIMAGQPLGAVALSPNGSKLYAINFPQSIFVIDTKTYAITATYGADDPSDIAVSPDGSKLWVVNPASGTVTVNDAATGAMLSVITIGLNPAKVVLSPDGSLAYVSISTSNYVSVINTSTYKVVTTIPVGTWPVGEVSSRDGSKLYVGNEGSNSVSVINTATNTVTAVIAIGSSPDGLAITPDGTQLFVSNSGSSGVSIVSTATNAITSTVPVGFGASSWGNFIAGGSGCSGTPIKFTITVRPAQAPIPVIAASVITGSIFACQGSAAVSPYIQQFTLSGSNLTGTVVTTAPAGFEISLSSGSGYTNTVTLTASAGTINNIVIYVRAAATAPAGSVSGNTTLKSAGAETQTVAVKGLVNASSSLDVVPDQTVNNGAATTAVNFTATGNTVNWVNDTPGIGLPATGEGNISSFTAVNTGSAPVTATITATPTNSGYAYITDQADNAVSVISLSNNTIVNTIPVGQSPFGVSVSRDGSRVYISNSGSNNVSVIDAASGKVLATIAVGFSPAGLAVSPDGSRLYVVNDVSYSVSVINTATYIVLTTIPVGVYPGEIVISPDGSRVYVTNDLSTNVSVINTATNTVIANIPVVSYPDGIAISPDGSTLYVANGESTDISVISTATNTVTSNLTLPVGNPAELAISPDGTRLYVTMGQFTGNNVYIFDTATGKVVASILTNTACEGLSVTPDGSHVYVANFGANAMDVINTATNTIESTITVPRGPLALGDFISPDISCAGVPKQFTITVNPTPATGPTIIAGAPTGSISACAGTASASPQIEQFTVSGSGLTGNITATASPLFEVSLSAGSGYGNSVIVPETGGTAGNTVVYIRSIATAPTGPISGSVNLASAGATTETVGLTATVYALPTINPVVSQSVTNGTPTTAINFTGTGDTFTWTNDTPGIGLAASGTGNIASFTAVNTGTTPVVATIAATPAIAGYLYVPYGATSVAVVNNITYQVLSTITVGQSPDGISVSPDGTRVYVANINDNSVSVINTSTNTVMATITVGTRPLGISVSLDGSQVYVANFNDGTVSIINTTTNTVSSTVTVGQSPSGVAVSPDGSEVYVTNTGSGTVSVINTTSDAVVAAIVVGSSPTGIALSPDGSRLYVANDNSGTVSVINTATNAVVATITTGNEPWGVLVSHDGSTVYVSNHVSNIVSVISTSSNSVTSTIPVGLQPGGISISADDTRVYVANVADGTVSVIETAANSVIATIPVGAYPQPFGNFVMSGPGCPGASTQFTITVKPTSSAIPSITASIATGTISACAGTASVSPQIQQFTVSGSNLAGNITATAPTGFEVSLSAGSGYGPSVTLTQAGGTVNSTTVYVRSSALAAMGNISGKVVLTSTTTTQFVAVAGMVNALPTVNTVPAQSVNSGVATAAINFTGTGDYYTWTNDTPGIGLAVSGTGNIASFTAVNTGSSPVTANITVTPKPSQFAYITDEGSNSVSVISTATNSIVANIPVGGYPIGVAVSPDGRFVYVVNRASVTLSVINTTTNAVTATIATGANPIGVAISPDGSRVYVTNEDDGTISVINTSTNAVTATVSVGQNPYGVVVSPDGSKVYVSNDNGSGTVTVVNAGSNTLIATVPVGVAPGGIVVSTDGSKVYVENFASNTVSVINTSTNLVIATIPVGTSPWGIALSPDGSRLYVSNQNSNDVFVINTADNSLVTTIPVGKNPYGVSVTADGASVYVANINSNTVSVISTVTNQVTATVAVAGIPGAFGSFITPGTNCTGVPTQFTITVNPALTIPNQVVNNGQTTMAVNFTGCDYSWVNNQPGIGLAGNGSGDINSFIAINNGVTPIVSAITATPVFSGFAYIANEDSNDVSVINTTTNKVVATVPVGSNPISVYADMKNKKIYVANKISNSISVIDPGTNMVIGTISLSVQPESVTVSPDGSRIYVGSGPGTEVLVIDAATDAIVSTITNPALEYSVNVAVSPDGSLLYVNAFESNGIYVISTKTNSIIASVAVADEPQSIQVTPDGATVYETNAGADDVEIINTATNTVPFNIPVGMQPEGLSLSPDGRLLYTANHQSNDVSVISTVTNSLVATIPVGSAPWGISVTPDGKEIYVANSGSNTVSVIDAATNRVISTIPVGKSPYSFGSFFYNTTTCNPITFTITVNPTPATSPNITATAATGNNTSCQGTASASPNIQQVQVSAINLTGAVSLTAPAGFEISLSATTGFGSSLTITPVGMNLTNVPVYVRLAATAAVGSNSGNIEGTSPGATTIEIAVTGTVNALPTVNTVPPQSVNNGAATAAIKFTGTGNTFTWVNDTPGIGLAASGTGDIGSFTGVNNGGSPITATVTATPLNAGFAYISNSASNSVSVINTATNMVVSNIPMGDDPQNVSVSPDGKKVYVTDPIANTVSVLSTATNTLVATIPVGTGAFGMIVSPDGTKVYLVNLNPAQSADNISVINTTTYAVASTITLGSKVGEIAISPDGNRLYVANYSLNTVSMINTATGAVTATVPVGSYPYGITASPDGSRVYVANEIDNTVSVISTSTNAVIATVPTGASPIGVAVSPDGSRLYVTNFFVNGTVSIINTNTNAVIATVPVGQAPAGVSVSADGRFVYVANSSSADVSVIDAATNSVILTVPVGSNPFSYGNFVSPSSCTGPPTQFTITVNPSPATGPNITANTATGSISACADMASVSPQIEQFTVSGSKLTGDITGAAPTGFEVSLSAGSGFGNTITITQSGGNVSNTVVYVRSSAAALPGPISGNVVLSSPGATSQDVAVDGVVNDLPAINTIAGLVTANGLTTGPVNFTGSGDIFTWTNDTPSIGLAASGTGNIASFTAVNPGASAVIATVTVTPGNTITGCTGAPEIFTITVGPTLPTAVTAAGTLNPLTTPYGTPSPAESFSVSGTSLTSGILVTPPAGFELSTDNVNFSATLTIGAGGNVSAQTVYIRLAAITPVGPYSGNIKVTSPGAAEFDLFMPVSTVTPALLAIIADDKSKTFGTLNPPLTATYVGFVNLETVANLTTPPLLATTATTFSPVGQYPITVTGASSANYTISYLDGTLTIAPTEQSIVIPNTFTPNGDGINDTWDIKFLDLFVNCSVDIFTRWGQKVYTSIGYSIPWDGTYKGSALPTGTYYYVINLKNGLSPLSGFVAIIR